MIGLGILGGEGPATNATTTMWSQIFPENCHCRHGCDVVVLVVLVTQFSLKLSSKTYHYDCVGQIFPEDDMVAGPSPPCIVTPTHPNIIVKGVVSYPN